MGFLRVLQQRVSGVLKGNGLLLLEEPIPAEIEALATPLYLRYALVTHGKEEHIFPAFLLDDWGNEKRGLGVYQWIREEGNLFPRAELFAVNLQGEEEQLFLRELELYVSLPCYLYRTKEEPVSAGTLLKTIYLPHPTALTPQPIPCPAHIKPPLQYARVQWAICPPHNP